MALLVTDCKVQWGSYELCLFYCLGLFSCHKSITLNLSVLRYKKCIFWMKFAVLWTASLYLCELVKEQMAPVRICSSLSPRVGQWQVLLGGIRPGETCKNVAVSSSRVTYTRASVFVFVCSLIVLPVIPHSNQCDSCSENGVSVTCLDIWE